MGGSGGGIGASVIRIQPDEEDDNSHHPQTNIAGWNIPMDSIGNTWKYIFNPGPFSIAMIVYRSVMVC